MAGPDAVRPVVAPLAGRQPCGSSVARWLGKLTTLAALLQGGAGARVAVG